MRVPDLTLLAEPPAAPTLSASRRTLAGVARRRRESTTIQHRTALNRVLPVLGIARSTDRADGRRRPGRRARRRREGARKHPQERRPRSRWCSTSPASSPNPARDRCSEAPARGARGARTAERRPRRGGGRVPAGAVPHATARARCDRRAHRRARGRTNRRSRRRRRGVARTGGGLEDAAGAMGRAARTTCSGRRRAGCRRARIATPTAPLFPGVTRRQPTDGDRARLPGCGRAELGAAQPSPPADQLAAPPGRLVGRDRRPRRPAIESRHGRPLHARHGRLRRDRPSEVARTCTHGALPRCTPRAIENASSRDV